jgi:ADP-heptose:LPS heptosyltransferase
MSNKKRKILLRNGQSPGDLLALTRGIADLKETYPDWEIDVRTPCMQIFENNPHLTPLTEGDEGVEIFDIDYPEIHNSGWSGIHFTEAFIRSLEDKLKVKIKRTGMRPEIWISDLEKTWINQVETEFGWKGKFWVINAGYKQDNELKHYHRWQEVAELFNKEFPDLRLVQVGDAAHIHPELEGVLNLVGKTDPRQLIRLIWCSQGTIGPISYQMHLSGAFQQPAVVVAGGKEPVRWEMYPNHRYLAVNGCLKCAAWDGCWKGGKLNECSFLEGMVPKCFAMIEPYQVIDAVKAYYQGGML